MDILEKNLEVSAKNLKFLLYHLEFKYLGGSCVGEECEVESERLNKTNKIKKRVSILKELD